jgi:membrane protein YqaA with SNARE-associated domain
MKYFLRALFAIIVLVGIFALQRQFAGSDFVQDFAMRGGYLGVFVFSFINSFNIIVPIVAPTLIPTWVSAGLMFLPVVFVMTAAVSTVDLGFFLLGRYSRGYLVQRAPKNKTYLRLKNLQERNFFLPLVMCGLWVIFMPLPNELVTIPLGFLGYRFLYVAPIIIVGNMFFNAFIGAQSLSILG